MTHYAQTQMIKYGKKLINNCNYYILSYFFIAKFIVSAACLQTSNGFCYSVNHLSGEGVNVNHNATHSPSLAGKNKTENDSRLLKNNKENCDDE